MTAPTNMVDLLLARKRALEERFIVLEEFLLTPREWQALQQDMKRYDVPANAQPLTVWGLPVRVIESV